MADLSIPMSDRSALAENDSGHIDDTKELFDYTESLRAWQQSIGAGAGGGEGAGGALLVAASNSPQSMKDRADYVCTGGNDQDTINTALLEGSVDLCPGVYDIASKINMRTARALFSSAWWEASLEPTTGNTDCVVGLADDTVNVTYLGRLQIHGRYRNSRGIDYVQDNTGSDWISFPDAVHTIEHMHIGFTGGDNIRLNGSGTGGGRATKISHMRLRLPQAGNCINASGFSDVHYVDIDASNGTATDYDCIVLGGGNPIVSTMKAWYAGRDGIVINGSRPTLTNISAQDCGRHGVSVNTDYANITGVLVDSNRHNDSVGVGVNIAGDYCSIMGITALDRNKGDATFHQEAGVQFSGTRTGIMAMGTIMSSTGTNHVTGTDPTQSFIRLAREGSTMKSVG